jgi:glycyl-tRNA synthetase
MLEVTTTNLISYDVLKTSGHVDKFSDFMVRDAKTNTPRRADKLIQEVLQKMIAKCKKPEEIEKLRKIERDADNYDAAQIDECIRELKIKDPETGNDLTPATPFNLMFENTIGPSGYMTGFLRPETAQGMFINFRRLIEFNNGKMPFAAAQIGMGFRNEISPRQGLLRVREFTMAEIEHFVDPDNKNHPKFESVS